MQHSSSAPALKNAGATMAHIPKRATQNGLYLPSWEQQCIDLKVGQQGLERNIYAQEAKPLHETFIHSDRPQQSVYAKMNTVLDGKPELYRDPVRPIKPSEPNEYCGHRGVAHWGSTSKSAHNLAAIENATYHRQDGPSYQASNPPTCVGRGEILSAFQEFHGKHGFKGPLSTVSSSDLKMPVLTHDLTKGTHKGTLHIPGYQGFIPTNTSNPYCARVASGVNTYVKVTSKSLTDQFHTNLLNYNGHTPAHPNNDRGGRSVDTVSTMGRNYQWPKQNAFPAM